MGVTVSLQVLINKVKLAFSERLQLTSIKIKIYLDKLGFLRNITFHKSIDI